jgi:hypothetical protein
MGFIKGIGKALKSVGKGLGSAVKGVAKFAKSPFGKLLINVGLSFLTGGTSNLLTQGLGTLSKLGGGKLLSTFGAMASKFLGPAQSFLSKQGLGSIASFLQSAKEPSHLLSMAKDLLSARQKAPATDNTTQQIIQSNLLELFAHRQAQLSR